MREYQKTIPASDEVAFHSEYRELDQPPTRNPVVLLATYFFCQETNEVRLQVDKVRRYNTHHEFIVFIENSQLKIDQLPVHVRKKLQNLFH